MLSAYNFDELGIPEDYGDSPKFGGRLCSGPEVANEMVKIQLVTQEVEEFLSILHSFLIEGRYGYVRAGLLMALYGELESDLAEKGMVNFDSLREAIDTLVRLDRQEREETSWLAYLAGNQRIEDDLPVEERARLLVEVLGLRQLLKLNLELAAQAEDDRCE